MRLPVSSQGAGRPLVLLHAFPLSSAMWADQRDGLSDVATVITPDLRGFGQAPLGAEEPSIDLLAADLAETLAALDLRGVVLGGLGLVKLLGRNVAFGRERAEAFDGATR